MVILKSIPASDEYPQESIAQGDRPFPCDPHPNEFVVGISARGGAARAQRGEARVVRVGDGRVRVAPVRGGMVVARG